MALTHDGLRKFLGEKLGLETGNISDDTELLSSGLLDSFSVVQLMTYIEEESGIQFLPADVGFATLDSIDRIMTYVATAGSHR